MDAVTAAYESASDRLQGLTLDDFRAAVQRCAVYPVRVDGAVCGAILVHENEIHACIKPEAHGRWFNRSAARILNEVIDRYGYAKTQATTPAGREFVERLGFVFRGDCYVKEVPYGH